MTEEWWIDRARWFALFIESGLELSGIKCNNVHRLYWKGGVTGLEVILVNISQLKSAEKIADNLVMLLPDDFHVCIVDPSLEDDD